MNRPLVIGSRGSDLALWQARHVLALLSERAGIESEIRIIRTRGDRIDSVAFESIEGKGFFTKELEEALLAGAIDVAVHSLKDLPTELPSGLTVGAILRRGDPRELLLINPDVHDPDRGPLRLRAGARVGTSSIRRRVQLTALQPDLVIEPLRGNVPTRLRRLYERGFDAILLALAGVERLKLDLTGLVALRLPTEVIAPAPGQGALAVELRSDDAELRAIAEELHDPETAAAVNAERSLLRRFGGGCSLPLGACLWRDGDRMVMHAFWSSGAGKAHVRVSVDGDDPTEIAEKAFHALTEAPVPLKGVRVVVTRPAMGADPLVSMLTALGATVVAFPVISIRPYASPEADAEARAGLDSFDWVLFPSANAVEQFRARLESWSEAFPASARIGAVGPGTARALSGWGREPDFVPEVHVSDAFLEGILARCERRAGVLIPSAKEGSDVLVAGLTAAGHRVVRLPVYETVGTDPAALDTSRLDGAHYILFASPSAVRHFLRVASLPEGARVVSIGPVTSRAAVESGLKVHAEAEPHTTEGLVRCLLKS